MKKYYNVYYKFILFKRNDFMKLRLYREYELLKIFNELRK